MAISIDAVYQKVLALANKEQRGYITPLEFNLLANQAQLIIFEQYFYDLNQFKRAGSDETSFSDMSELIKNKLTEFTSIEDLGSGVVYPINYRTGRIFTGTGTVTREAKLISINELQNILDSQFHVLALAKNPVYVESSIDGYDIEVYEGSGMSGFAQCEVISKPYKVEWGYDVIAEKALYNASSSTNFQLHESEESLLVIKILELAGVILNKPGLVQAATQEEIKTIQQQKQ